MSHEDELADAAEKGYLDVVLDLLGKGANVNAKDRNPDEHVPAADLFNFLRRRYTVPTDQANKKFMKLYNLTILAAVIDGKSR